MSRSPVSLRRLAALVLVALAAGAIAARADSGDARRVSRIVARPVAVPVAPAVPAVAGAYAGPALAAAPRPFPAPAKFLPLECARPAESAPAGAPPSNALLDAFAILRRDRRPEDALPAEALAALKQHNLAPVSPESARLLRTTSAGGRAWVVPVPDVSQGFPFPCRPRGKAVAREGLAVVALGDAAPGGGGALDDLVRGRAPVWVDACSGQNHDLVGISGIVPDGVAATFLTSPDGTAVRADVKDNAYEFLVPRPHAFEQRYVVSTGGDGTPHVQPVVATGALRGAVCERLAKLRKMPQVTPVGYLRPCVAPSVLPTPIAPPHVKRDRVGRLRVPAPFLVVGCSPVGPIAVPPPALRPRPARKHR